MNKRGKFLLIFFIVILLILFIKPVINLVSASSTAQANVYITFLGEQENYSIYGIFEPLCCAGGTGDWCLDNNQYNETTHSGDVYCEGSNAGESINVNVQHVLRFNFSGITIGASDELECIIEQSDGSILRVNKTGLTLNSQDYFLAYAISNESIITRDESDSTHDLPWGVHNCSILYSNGTNVSYDRKDVIFVHRNLQWSVFDYQKAVFAESVPYKFFNNTRALKKYYIDTDDKSYTRYLAFRHYAGSQTEEFCFDEEDNDNDGLIDNNDSDCRTFAHRYNVSEMNFTVPNFLMVLGLFRTTGYAISNDADNIVTDSLSDTNYWFTRNTDLDGSFKIRIYETSPGSSGYGYTIQNFPNVSSVNLIGILPSGYTSSYACGGDANLPEGFCNINLDCASCGNELIDFVFIVNSSDSDLDASSTLTLQTVHGTTIETENFDVYFDPDDGLNNTLENETSSATDTNLCDDSMNNDLDISTDYTYLNALGTTNKITWSRDCADIDCVGINGPAYSAEQDITFSQGDCEYKTELSCNDGYDNDFNDNYLTDAYGMQGYSYTDCHDVDCFGNNVECPSSESICNDGLNNDWDYVDTDSESSSGHKIGNTNNVVSGGITWDDKKYHHIFRTYNLIDCEDPDCNNSVGGNSGEICEWGMELNCSDDFNNDALQTYDCELIGSYGLYNSRAPSYSHAEYDCSSYCRSTVDNEENGIQCDDGLDNDYDYWSNTGIFSGTVNDGIDCGWNGTGRSYNPDSDCHLETMGNGYRCELGIELTCNDNFSNDYDSTYTSRGGWNEEDYNDYFSTFGMSFVSNADCDDYDCQGVGNCPISENPGGNYDAWCFDGADNDLDGDIDCSDSDCVGAKNPDNDIEVCYEYELNDVLLTDSDPNTSSIQLCGNNKDDENKDDDNSASPSFSYNSIGFTYTGDRISKMDCNDEDCRQKFGQCAPCSSNEFVEWDSCFDLLDNDHDSNIDSSDTDCDSQIIDERGYNSTNKPIIEIDCMNEFDDDGDGDADCEDSDCAGLQFSPDGRICRVGSEIGSNCSDDFDNDEDGDIDCFDSGCASACGLTAISGSGITHAPTNSSFSLTGDVTMSGTATAIARKGGDLYVSYSYSGGSLGGITIVLGSYATAEVINTSVFDVSNAEFVSNPNGFSMDTTYANDGYLTFTRSSISSFSFTIRIPGKNVVSNSFTVKSTAEIGTNTAIGSFSTQVVNNESPEIAEIRMEPSEGNLSAGDKLQVIVGNFTGYSNGQSNSGQAGRCRISVTGPNGFSIEEYRNDCKSSSSSSWRIYTTGTYIAQVTIYDNTGNEGNVLIDSLNIEVVAPKISLGLSRSDGKRVHFASRDSNYDTFDDEYNSVTGTMLATFTTDTNNPYDSDACQLIIRDSDNSVVSTQDISATLIDSGQSVQCLVDGRLDLDLSSDGLYTATVKATDGRGHELETSRIVFFNCNSLSSDGISWNCSLADFDVDGYTEGIMLPFNYSDDGSTFYQLACDSCPGETNLGKDTNGDGYDNVCDPICGDGYKEGNEECDDGNTDDGDGCDSNCNLEEGEEVPSRGGGGGAAAPEEEIPEEVKIIINPEPFSNEIRQGQSRLVELIISSLVDYDLNIVINYSEFERFMLIENSEFILGMGESEILNVEIFANYDEIPEVYIGNIEVYANELLHELNTILEIKEKVSLFDITTRMVEKVVTPGENATAIINMTDIGDFGPVNATLYYAIKDFENNTLVFNEEEVLIDEFLSVEKTLQLPKDAEDRNYVFYSKISYEEFFATSSDTFTTSKLGNWLLFIIVLLLILIIVIVIIILHNKNKRLTENNNH